MTAFAHPEFTRTPWIPWWLFRFSKSLLKVTGAAWNLFFVNTAAAAHGRSEAMKARSGFGGVIRLHADDGT